MGELRRDPSIDHRTADDHRQERQVNRQLTAAAVRGGAAAVHVDEVRDAVKREIGGAERNQRGGDTGRPDRHRARTRHRCDRRDVDSDGRAKPRTRHGPARGLWVRLRDRALDRERDPVREQHERNKNGREDHAAARQRHGEAGDRQEHGRVEPVAAPGLQHQRNDQQNRRDENGNEDRDPEGLSEEHARRMLSCPFGSGKEGRHASTMESGHDHRSRGRDADHERWCFAVYLRAAYPSRATNIPLQGEIASI